MSHSIGADSEVGCLRTVLVHRPGPELKRVTPRTKDRLDFGGMPWVSKAQQEHDVLTDVLRDRGAEVLYIRGLLQDVLEYSSAREEAIAAALADGDLGDLGIIVGKYLESLTPEDLASVLLTGLTSNELRSGRGLVYEMLDPRDFVIKPLPNLVFSRDSSLWVGDQAIVTGLSGPRRREAGLMAAIYRHHPRFGGLKPYLQPAWGRLDGGDVLLLAPGVIAVGVGDRTSPASAEHLARHVLDSGVVHTVLAVPMTQRGPGSHLDRLCTVVGWGTVIMIPALAFTMTALTITARWGDLRVSRPRPFLEAAARAIGADALTVIDTGIDGPAGLSGQWDDGGNALAIAPHVTVCDERNVETNARLAAAGFEVITVPGGELGGIRGGPRCLCAPVHRDPVTTGETDQALGSGQPLVAPRAEPALIDGAAVPEPAGPASGQSRRVSELTPMG